MFDNEPHIFFKMDHDCTWRAAGVVLWGMKQSRKIWHGETESIHKTLSPSKTWSPTMQSQSPYVIVIMNPNSCLYFGIWDLAHVRSHAAYVGDYTNKLKRKKKKGEGKEVSSPFVVSVNHCRFVAIFVIGNRKSKKMTQPFLGFGWSESGPPLCLASGHGPCMRNS